MKRQALTHFNFILVYMSKGQIIFKFAQIEGYTFLQGRIMAKLQNKKK